MNMPLLLAPDAERAKPVSPGPALAPPLAIAHGRTDVTILLGRFGTGGVERVACLLANGFAQQGWAVRIVAAGMDGPARALLDDDIAVAALLPDSGGKRYWRLLRAILALRRHIRADRPAVLLSPGNHTHLAAVIAHRLAGCPEVKLVLKITNPLTKRRQGVIGRVAVRLFYRWVFDRAARILVLSRSRVGQIAAIAGRPLDVRFVHNPYIPAVDAPAPLPDVSATPVILAVGRFTKQKNLGLLLEAVALLPHRDWRLVLLGEGPQEGALMARADALGIAERVAFCGFVMDPAPFYAQATCLAIPSLWEDLPAVALEAMGRGCPVIATDCSTALSDIVRDSGFGRIVASDAQALANAIAAYLARPPEREVPDSIAAYSIANGISDHVRALAGLVDR